MKRLIVFVILGTALLCLPSRTQSPQPVGTPKGSIVAWLGLQPIPSGWAVCDGTQGTPDLRGKLIVGAVEARGEKSNIPGPDLLSTKGEGLTLTPTHVMILIMKVSD